MISSGAQGLLQITIKENIQGLFQGLSTMSEEHAPRRAKEE